MKRFDLALLATLCSLAVFVGVQARETRVTSHEREDHGEAAALAKGSGATSRERNERGTVLPVVTVRSAKPPRPTLGPEEILRRLRERSGGTFISDVIVAHDSALARWPDR